MKVKTNIRAGAGANSNKPTKTSVTVFNPFLTAARCVGI
jgi:hypothetical protein